MTIQYLDTDTVYQVYHTSLQSLLPSGLEEGTWDWSGKTKLGEYIDSRPVAKNFHGWVLLIKCGPHIATNQGPGAVEEFI